MTTDVAAGMVARTKINIASLVARTGTTIRAYVAMTKPRIIELLLVTTLPAMVLAADGWPGAWLVAMTMIGGTAAAGSANVLNCVLDRDIDQVMRRTARRPLTTGEVSTRGATGFGVVLAVAALTLLWFTTTPLATGLTGLAIVIYVVGYTLVLKRRTSSNIVWGGAAGCLPTLIGWAAVTGRLSVAAFLLFGVVFFWTPPHFWALAMRFRDDYAAAGVPMLPVVASPQVVVRRMLRYTVLTIATTLVLWPIGHRGLVYVVGAVGFGAYFLREVVLLRRRVAKGEPTKPMRVFHASITYLTGVFLFLALDVLVGILNV
ncbi:MAG: heme o synthase [Cellulomonas sp.]